MISQNHTACSQNRAARVVACQRVLREMRGEPQSAHLDCCTTGRVSHAPLCVCLLSGVNLDREVIDALTLRVPWTGAHGVRAMCRMRRRRQRMWPASPTCMTRSRLSLSTRSAAVALPAAPRLPLPPAQQLS